MSAGGINAQPSLAAYAGPVAGAPIAGQQAGSVAPAGGDVSIPRTVAIAAGVGGSAYQRQNAAAATGAQVAGQQVVDPSLTQPGVAAGAAASGPAAWNDEWAAKFKEAGAPAQTIQQLNFTGAMGYDAAQLQQMLDQVKGEIDNVLAPFAHEHPEMFKKLMEIKDLHKYVDGSGDVNRATVAKLAAGLEAGQITEKQLEEMVETAGKTPFDMFVKPMIVWSLIPGWGALRLLPAPFTGGRDILTGEKMFGDPMITGFTVLAGLGGAMTIANNVKGAMQVAKGHQMIATAGSDAATIAAREGLDNLTFGKKLWSYVPGTGLNQQVAGISRLDDLKAGIAAMSDDVIQGTKFSAKELAEAGYARLVNGDAILKGDPASKFMKGPIPGYQPNSRGVIMGQVMGKKAASTVVTNGARPELMYDLRTVGKISAANLAADSLALVDDTIANNALKSRVFGNISPTNTTAFQALKDTVYAHASKQILDSGAVTRRTGLANILGTIRPDALQDAMWASNNIGSDTVGKVHGWLGLNKWARRGIIGGAIAAGGYFIAVKPQLDAIKDAKKQAEEAAAQQQAGAGAGGGAIDPSQLSAEDQAVLQQFAAMPADQQAQIIQQQYAQVQQALQTPNMTAEQQQQVAGAQAELELLMQVAQGGAAAGGQPVAGQGAAASAPAATAPAAAAPAAPAAAPQFTAQGLGLAP